MVDGTTSSAAWRGVVIRPGVVVDVVGRGCVAMLVDGDLRVWIRFMWPCWWTAIWFVWLCWWTGI